MNSNVKNVSIYFTSNIINKSIPFLLLPVLTKYLTPAEYGIIAIFQVLITFASPLIGINLSGNISRNFFDKSKEQVAQIVSNLFIILLTSFVISVFFLGVYSLFYNDFLGIDIKWLFAIPIIIFFHMITQFNITILRNSRKAISYGIYHIVSTILDISSALYFIVICGMGWEGRAFSIIFASIIIGLASFIHIVKTGYLKINYNKDTIRIILGISIPLIFYSIGSIVINMSDRIIIDRLLGKGAVGLYAVGYSFGAIISLFTSAFNNDWSAWIYKQFAQINEERKKLIVKCIYLYSFGIIFLAIVMTYISYFLIDIMTDPRFHTAKEYVIWVSLGYAINGMYQLIFPFFNQTGKTRPLAVIWISVAIVNLLLTYLFVKQNGAIGAAQATLISFILIFIITWLKLMKIYSMPWFFILKNRL